MSLRRKPEQTRLFIITVLTLMIFPFTANAAQDGERPAPLLDKLMDMSLQELMDIEITSVSKRPEKIFKAAAAVFVISSEDLREWGVTNIPDALRRVPGLQVARMDSNKWAITARGFNSRFANKLLVLIDGRSVYSPLFAGVYWEMLDTPIEDIERIEVIRGPGGTLWGANAVNGVINIITRRSDQTQSGMVSAVAGQEDNGTTLRYGGALSENVNYRVYGKFFSHDMGYSTEETHDDWTLGQTGFRADWQQGTANTLVLQGDYFSGTAGQQRSKAIDPPPLIENEIDDVTLNGRNLLFRWQHALEVDSDFSLQLYYDYVGRDGDVLYEDRDTIDVDFQHHLARHANHDIVWGLGYRRITDETLANPNFALNPAELTSELFSVFFQDELTLSQDELFLTLGSKLEHNDFTDWEVQPNARITFTPDNDQTLWGAISRAVRTPSRGEQHVRLRLLPVGSNSASSVPLILQGSSDFESEELIAYEAGYRLEATDVFLFDAALFFNVYDKLRTFDAEVFTSEIQYPFDNRMKGKSYGFEVTGQWQAFQNWRIQGSYSFINMSLDLKNGSADTQSKSAEDASPRHQASLWSSWQLGTKWDGGLGMRYMGSIEAPGNGVESYLEFDGRLSWEPTHNMTLSLVGQNLLNAHHQEFQPDFILTQPTEVERSIYCNLTWHF